MTRKLFINIKVLLLCLFSCTCFANTVDTEELVDIPPQIQIAVDCFNYILNDDYNNFFTTLHPHIIENTGGAEKIREAFNMMVAQMKDARVKLEIKGARRVSRSTPPKYLIDFRMYMQDGGGSNIITTVETPTGWKVIDI